MRASWWALIVGGAILVSTLGMPTARAKECTNRCKVGDGDLCAAMTPIVELGRSITVIPGRQRGTCGGVEPVALDELVLTWGRDPAGPFTPMPVSRIGDAIRFTPDRAGPYFIEVAARNGVGAPYRQVIMALEPTTAKVRLRLHPGDGPATLRAAVKVRWIPTGPVDRFPRERWPVWRDNDRAGQAADPLRLPPGHYDVEWTDSSHRTLQTGVTPIDVTGPGWVDVPLTAPSPAAVHPTPR
jgi:hypothetical protein